MLTHLLLTMLFLGGMQANQLRIYDNPLNNRAIDLFILVDETTSRLTLVQFGQMKIAVNRIVTDLQPGSSTPYFGVYFYGSTSAVDTVVPFGSNSATTVSKSVDLKQYTATQLNPSSLSAALDSVNAACHVSCRPKISRVTVIFTSSLDLAAEPRIRQLEDNFGMTVIIVAIGSGITTSVLQRLASHPTNEYGVPFGSFTELIVSTSLISFLISNVPRVVSVGEQLSLTSTLAGTYYTLQVNTKAFIRTNDTVVAFTTNCKECVVYSSLSQTNPTSANAIASINPQYFYAPGYAYPVYYFRIPQNTNRFYFSFLGTGMQSVTGIFNVFDMPQMMTF